MALILTLHEALRELNSAVPALQQAMTVIMETRQRDISIETVRVLADRLKTYDLDDVEWCLEFMTEHPVLREYWAATVHQLEADEFHLYLDRLDDLWERLTGLPGVSTDTAWGVLNGYRGKDPGTKRSHGTAVFLINAAILTSMQACDFAPAESGITSHTRYSAFAGESFDELSPQMIDFAIERAADVDRIVEVVLSENLWQVEALRYRLDGELTATSEATEIAYPMIMQACDSSASRLDHFRTTFDGDEFMTADKVLSLNATQTNSLLLRASQKIQSNDLAALRAHRDLINDCSSVRASFKANVLDIIIKDLRTIGVSDMSVIDRETIPRVGTLNSTIHLHGRDKGTPLPEKSKHWDHYGRSLRTAAAIGPASVKRYIEDDSERAISLAVQHEAITYPALVSVIEEVVSHGALADGFI